MSQDGKSRSIHSDFLAGGGEMGARMRALDWSATPLGAADGWPQSLKTIVRVMLDSRYAMWMLWGREFTFFCNDAYLPTVGIKRDWVLGARSDKVWEEIWPDIGPRIRKVLEEGQATWDEGLLLFLERSGFPEETYHTFSYSPIYDESSRISGMLCVVTEVTERVIGERRLRVLRDLAARAVGVESVQESCRRACEVLSQYALDVPFAGLYLIDSDAGQAHLMGRTRELPETALPEVVALDDPASAWPWQDMVGGETAQHVRDLARVGLDIPAKPWPDPVKQALVLPLKSAGHGLAGFLIVGISPRRPLDEPYRSFLDLVANQVGSALSEAQAYEAERRRAEALAEVDRAKTAFFSNVSHEFRTPLTLMLGPLEETMRDTRLPGDARERIELAQRNAERLQKLVNSLLDFSRIEAGRVQASYEPTDLGALTRDLASTFRSAMDRAGLSFTVECLQLDQPVYVDREMWEKVVLNLLSNAFKFTLAGEVAVRLSHNDQAAVLEVSDTGIGVPEHELPRLFERFHRVEGAQGRTHEGSGIGLALVQELVKLHGGTIEVSSAPGKGTRFAVHVPMGSAHLPADRIKAPRGLTSTAIGARVFVQEALRWLQDPADSAPSTSAASADKARVTGDRRFAATFGARVVLADDNSDMRAYVRELLAPYYEVEVVADGEQALATARRAPADLILTDVMMPRLDGFGLLARIRSDEALRSTPVVLLSARAGEESRIEAFDAGADDYVTKPFSARELLARVGALLELRHMRRTAEEAFRLRTAQFETLLTEAPLGVYLVDAEFRIREVNPTARAVFGDIPGLIGSDFDAVVHRLWPQTYADEVVGIFRHTLATGNPHHEPEHIEQRLDRGVTEYYEWQISRIPLPDGQHGVVCYFRDISAHVKARTRLELADRHKDEFLAMLAHELRNPLAPIRSAGEVLAQFSGVNPDARAAIGIVHRQVSILTRLVDDLLDVSRITQGRIQLQLKTIRLPDVIAQAVEIVDPLIKERHHRISISSYGTLWIKGDAARLVQCVSNLLTNAAKYTDPYGEIHIESRDTGTDAVLTVRDNGIGMPAELLSRVFALFVQSDRSLDRAQGGIGIGLSVVKRLVEMHGGRVAAFSNGPRQGSMFEIRLPLTEREEEQSMTQTAVQVPPLRILVVDDNVDAADSLAMMLKLQDHEVQCTYSAYQALELLEGFTPDVALLDIGLPEMDGYELARRIRSHGVLAQIGLIALSGYGQAEDKERALKAGFDYHLTKPTELHTLEQVLMKASAR